LIFYAASAKYIAVQYEKEEIMMIVGISRLLVDNMFCSRSHNDNGIVRMFEVEYSNDYRAAKRAGVHIDRQYVEEFLKTMK
jgi:hypothetical protein